MIFDADVLVWYFLLGYLDNEPVAVLSFDF